LDHVKKEGLNIYEVRAKKLGNCGGDQFNRKGAFDRNEKQPGREGKKRCSSESRAQRKKAGGTNNVKVEQDIEKIICQNGARRGAKEGVSQYNLKEKRRILKNKQEGREKKFLLF